jgi:hypothetical protein
VLFVAFRSVTSLDWEKIAMVEERHLEDLELNSQVLYYKIDINNKCKSKFQFTLHSEMEE